MTDGRYAAAEPRTPPPKEAVYQPVDAGHTGCSRSSFGMNPEIPPPMRGAGFLRGRICAVSLSVRRTIVSNAPSVSAPAVVVPTFLTTECQAGSRPDRWRASMDNENKQDADMTIRKFIHALSRLLTMCLLLHMTGPAAAASQPLWVAESQGVLKIAASDGGALLEIPRDQVGSLAVDPVSGDVWVYANQRLLRYGADGQQNSMWRSRAIRSSAICWSITRSSRSGSPARIP